MGHRVTVKGQVTIPKAVRDRLGIRPGDRVDFVPGPMGVELRRTDDDLRAAITALQRSRPRDGHTTDAYMALVRDEP